MGLRTFKGGIHPYDGKSLSKSKPIEKLGPKGDLVFPLSQHIGAPANPIVEVGQTVLMGQKIAEANGFVSSAIFSSVSGTVKAIEPRRVAVGDMVNSIVIENDGLFNEVEYVETEDITSLSKEEILEKIREAGVVGMGGAGFPTHVKLAPKEPDKIDYVIANCAECEPYLTSDYRRMIEEPEKLVGGLSIIVSMFPNARGYFGVEDNKPDCIERLRALTKNNDKLEVVPLRTKYPQGGERSLIKAITGRELNAKTLPAEMGCVVDNVETVVAIYNAVRYGRPLINRIFTVTGEAVRDPRNFYIHIGTNFSELLEAAGGLAKKAEKMIAGGPMMGFSLFETDIPTTKTTSALLCLTRDVATEYESTACINCGRCGDACPENLLPGKLNDLANQKRYEQFEKWYGLECVECGCCTFSCPARRHLAQSIKTAKKLILASKRKG